MFDVNDEIDELIDCYNESVEFEYVMEAYNVIADELQNRVDNGELTLEDAEILNDLAYNRYITEKKTTLEYRKEKFKKNHNYDPKTKTAEFDGQKVKVNFTGGSRKKNATINASILYRMRGGRGFKSHVKNIGNVKLNDSVFNQKHPKTHEMIANHEVGHLKDTKREREMAREKRKIDSVTKLPPEIQKLAVQGYKEAKKDNPDEKVLDNLQIKIENLCKKYNIDINDDTYKKHCDYDDIKLKIDSDIRKNKVNTSHGKNHDEYLADLYAKNKVGAKNYHNAIKDIKKNIIKRDDPERLSQDAYVASRRKKYYDIAYSHDKKLKKQADKNYNQAVKDGKKDTIHELSSREKIVKNIENDPRTKYLK